MAVNWIGRKFLGQYLMFFKLCLLYILAVYQIFFSLSYEIPLINAFTWKSAVLHDSLQVMNP